MPSHEHPQVWETDGAAIVDVEQTNQSHAHVLIVRHGERFDEVRGNNWYEIAPRGFENDPPLTEMGRQQAVAAAQSLVPYWNEHKFESVFSSPALRCVQTAVALIGELQRLVEAPIRIDLVTGLAACCAAAQYAGPAFPVRPLNELIALSKPYSPIPVTIQNKSPKEWEWFHPCIARLAHEAADKFAHAEGQPQQQQAPKTPLVICVTHREGLRDLATASGYYQRCRVPYCATAVFGFVRPVPGAGGEAESSSDSEPQGCIQSLAKTIRPKKAKKQARPRPPQAQPGLWSIVQHWVDE